jgi:hypothetical protein
VGALNKRDFNTSIIVFLSAIIISVSCGPKQDKVEKIVEDGVEVVINHLEPYRIRGELSTFELEKEVTVDTEREDLAELGISRIRSADVDRDGNVYFISNAQIFKFDSQGSFIQTIGQEGKGPGEIHRAGELRLTVDQKISIYDAGNRKFLFFNKDGSLTKEIKDTSKISVFGGAMCLDNGNFLFEEIEFDPEGKEMSYHLIILDEAFDKIKALDGKVTRENPLQSARYNLFDPYFSYQITEDRIYLVNPQQEVLEIELYNLQGELLKKIKKQSRKIKIPEEYKQKIINSMREGSMWDLLKDKVYIQENFPSFKFLYVDDEGRILVETYEKGENPDEYMLDIFNSDGVLIGRKSLKEALGRKLKNNRMYCAYEKESGYQELVVYKMKWK